MDIAPSACNPTTTRPFVLHRPARQSCPLVFTSPHSGRAYPIAFLTAARLDPLSLRRSEDCFVDELFAAAPKLGAPLLAATFPRAYCDANRAAWELDPGMFSDPLPPWVDAASRRAAAGLGTIPRVVALGDPIYRGKLAFKEAEMRVRHCWMPFHAALADLIRDTRARFGVCLLLDCHSMPSEAGRAAPGADFILGDACGTACAGGVVRQLTKALVRLGYGVRLNDPYSGGYITRHYGEPAAGIHAIQIEISRRLYMDERRLERLASFERVAQDIACVIRTLVAGWRAMLSDA